MLRPWAGTQADLEVAPLDERGARGDVVDVDRGVHLLDLRVDRPDARVRVDRH